MSDPDRREGHTPSDISEEYFIEPELVEARRQVAQQAEEIARLRAVIKKAADECLDCDGTNEIDTTGGRMACMSCYGLRAALAPRAPGEKEK